MLEFEKQGNQEGQKIDAEKQEAIVTMITDMIGDTMNDEFSLDNVETSLLGSLRQIMEMAAQRVIEQKDVASMDCPICQQKMKIKEKASRKIKGILGIEYSRRVFVCKGCGHIEKPLDKKLNCEDGYSTELKKAMVLLGKNMPFEEASDMLEKLLHVEVSARPIRELVEKIGNEIAVDEVCRVSKTVNSKGYVDLMETDKKKEIKGVAYLQVDGSMVQTRKLGWKEVKTGILFVADNVVRMDKHHRMILEKKYFSVFNNGESSLKMFTDRCTQECYDFGFHNYETAVIIADGAQWIWDYVSVVHPDAIQILDYYHACEYLVTAWKSISDKLPEREALKQQCFDWLEEGNIRSIITCLQQQNQAEAIEKCVGYYEKNIDRMKYGTYRAQGLDIGSGAIESAHRTVVQKRMKQSGMHWGKENVQSIISLRAMYLSGQWTTIQNTYIKKVA